MNVEAPLLMAELQVSIDKILRRVQLMESFKFNMEPDEFKLVCVTRARPRAVKAALTEAGYRLESLKSNMLQEFMEQRDRFEAEIAQIGSEADKFSTYGDIKVVEKIGEKMDNILDRLETAKQEMAHIQARALPPHSDQPSHTVGHTARPHCQLY